MLLLKNMERKTINFIMTTTAEQPFGGYKVVFEYADRLSADNYNVNIVYPTLIDRNVPFYRKLVSWFRYLRLKITGSYRPDSWFRTAGAIRHCLVWTPDEKRVPPCDMVFATSWQTAEYVDRYYIVPEHKYYLIQHLEDWTGNNERLLETWKMPLKKIVVADWLKKFAEKLREPAELIYNGFDAGTYYIENDVRRRNKYSVIMMYHIYGWKGSDVGIKALEMVRKKYPELKVLLFGSTSRPVTLPQWMEYRQAPDNLRRLYNDSAIYIGTSYSEGFGLTIGEAMLCGCAVACTNNGGYLTMARDGETALVSEVGDEKGIAASIERLIADDELRYRLIENAGKMIQNFTWDKSYAKLKAFLEEA